MKWIFVTTQFPWPIIHGRWLRVYHLARALVDAGETVSVLSNELSVEGKMSYEKIGATALPGLDRPHLSQGPGLCAFAPVAYDPQFADIVRNCAKDMDVVALSGTRMMQYAKDASLAATVICEMVDDPLLEFGRRNKERNRSIGDRIRSRLNRAGRIRLEGRCLPYIALTSYVSKEDCKSFNRRHPDARTVFIPNGVDADYFKRPESLPLAGDGGTQTVVFTGHMSNPNNERASMFLVKEVAPLIWDRLPNVKIRLVGAEPSQAMLALASKGVDVTGRVEDMRPYLWGASVVILPMQSGTGIKNKLLEAWAASAPVVATPLACQGVLARNGGNLILGNSAMELAKAVIHLLDSPGERQKLAAAGRETVVTELTWESAAHRMIQSVIGD
jgi:glycosyltransferase involved in cell wall biosynthesis